jgi:hypothetical protein
MITNREVQIALVTYLKTITAVTSLLANSDEVREDQWQGTDFLYPCIRVRTNLIVPNKNPKCSLADASFSILCYSEKKSSMEAETIGKAVAEQLHGRQFTASGVRFASILATSIVPAVAKENNTWLVENQFTAIVSE